MYQDKILISGIYYLLSKLFTMYEVPVSCSVGYKTGVFSYFVYL